MLTNTVSVTEAGTPTGNSGVVQVTTPSSSVPPALAETNVVWSGMVSCNTMLPALALLNVQVDMAAWL